MSLGDIVGRTDALLGKYGKYDEPDPERGPSGKEKGKGAFNGLFAQLQSDCEALEQVPPLRPRPSPPPAPSGPSLIPPLPWPQFATAGALTSPCSQHLWRQCTWGDAHPQKKKKRRLLTPPPPPSAPGTSNLRPRLLGFILRPCPLRRKHGMWRGRQTGQRSRR